MREREATTNLRLIVLVFWFGALLTGASGSGIPAGTSYFVGTESRFALDERIPYGNTPCATRVEMSGDGGRIVFTTLQPNRSPSGPPLMQVLTLTRRGQSLVFEASRDAEGPVGTVTFRNSQMNTWQGEFIFSVGSEHYRGTCTKEGLSLRMELTGVPTPMVVRWTLKAVSQRDHDLEVKDMLPRPGSE